MPAAAPGQAQRASSKFIVFEKFTKMNTKPVRQALPENELAWLENLQPIADNNFTSVPGPLPAITSISESITAQYFANLGTVDYIISFTAVGSGWATNIATAVSTRFAPAGTFSNPDATVWQSKYVLINDPKASYCFWDGTNFTKQGGVSPNLVLTAGGTGFTSVPSVTISGGSGSGATATATIGTPAVVAVSVNAGGSQYGPAPTVVFAGGGGAGAAATANIDPRGLTSITVTNGGSYISTPGVQFTGGGGALAAATANMTPIPGGGFTIASISITNPGSNYSSAPAISFIGGGGGGGGAATCTVGNGAVLSITVTAGGGGYTSPPTVSFSGGGSGSGAAATASIGGSSVISLILTNPGSGYLSSDVLTLTISGGGGTGATGTAKVSPFTTPGSTIAVFAGRVWLAGLVKAADGTLSQRLLQYTGTLGFDDFNPANASGSLTVTDADLVHGITALRNYNNYLFVVGDQSVKQIGSISVSGSTTLFTLLTLSSDVGTIYPRSCGSFNRVFMFANPTGIYAVLGSSVQKISDDMDGIWKLVDFSQQPQAAICDINNIHNIAWLVIYKDPLTTSRSIMLTFDGKRWFLTNQPNPNFATITTASKLSTGKTLTFASSGTDITQILADYTFPASFKFQTAQTHHGNAVQKKRMLAGGTTVTATGVGAIQVNFDADNTTVAKVYALNGSGFQLPGGHSGVGGSGRYLGVTITGDLAGFTLNSAALEYEETSLWT